MHEREDEREESCKVTQALEEAVDKIKTQEDLIVSLQSQVGIVIENCVPLRDKWTTPVAILLSWLLELPFQTLGSRCF